jgi:DNA adenine methylase
MIRRSLFRYYGGKWRIALWIISYFPPHCVYVELFGGGGSMCYAKDVPMKEFTMTLTVRLSMFFALSGITKRSFKRRFALTPFLREEYALSYQSADDPVEEARRTPYTAGTLGTETFLI